MLDLSRRRSPVRCDFVGLRVDIYRPAGGGDATAGGASAPATTCWSWSHTGSACAPYPMRIGRPDVG